MKLKDVMSSRIQDASPSESLREAAQKMRSLDVGSLPVCENDQVIGLITDRDIAIRAVAEGRDPNETQVRDVMSNQLFYCYEDDSVEAAAHLMEQQQIRRLPILDRDMRLCGVISLGDIATRVHDEHLSAEVLEQVSESAMPHA